MAFQIQVEYKAEEGTSKVPLVLTKSFKTLAWIDV